MNYRTSITQNFLVYPRLPDGQEIPKWVSHTLVLEIETHGPNVKPTVIPIWEMDVDLRTLEILVKTEHELLNRHEPEQR